MLTTAVSVLAAVALLLPGFIIAELSAARGARSSRSDLELALRALTYALLVHLVFSAWTADLVRRVDMGGAWHEHVGALALYSGIVLVAVPIVLGVLANVAIARAERRDGPAALWAAALGAGEARDGYDFMWQRVSGDGAWVIVELVGHTADEPRLVGGLYGGSRRPARRPPITICTSSSSASSRNATMGCASSRVPPIRHGASGSRRRRSRGWRS